MFSIKRAIVILAILTLSFTGLSPATAQTVVDPPGSMTTEEARAYYLVRLNDYRADNGLKPVQMDPRIVAGADKDAEELREHFLNGSEGKIPLNEDYTDYYRDGFTSSGFAWATGAWVDRAFFSLTFFYRTVLLDPEATHVGIGIADGVSDEHIGIITTAYFASYPSAVEPEPTPTPEPTIAPSPTPVAPAPTPTPTKAPSPKPTPKPTVTAPAPTPKPTVTAPAPKPQFKDVPAGTMFAKEINWLATEGISNGWPDKTYRPLSRVQRDAIAAFTYRMEGSPAFRPSGTPFNDVSTSNVFYKEIAWFKAEGHTNGWPDKTYRPLSSVNRDAMAAFLYRTAGEPAFTAPKVSPFRDVNTNNVFYKEIAWLASTDITTGWPDGTFRPLSAVNRDTMAAFLYRFDHKFN